jgi:CTP synthase (UTP-ammonia lyase)
MIYHKLGLDTEILKFFKLNHSKKPDLTKWQKIKDAIENPQNEVNVAIVGKYNDYKDSYKSLIEAINHGAFSLKTGAILRGEAILIDDVVTTGATFWAATHALIEVGAQSVVCVAPSRTV